MSLSLSVTSNKSGLLVQSNYNKTEYMCGPCERLIVKEVYHFLILSSSDHWYIDEYSAPKAHRDDKGGILGLLCTR